VEKMMMTTIQRGMTSSASVLERWHDMHGAKQKTKSIERALNKEEKEEKKEEEKEKKKEEEKEEEKKGEEKGRRRRRKKRREGGEKHESSE
jgi:hypothetical protein